MTHRRGPIELDASRCRELLTSGSTGRIGVSTPLGPQVIPVSYTVVHDAVVLWASPYSLVARSAPGTIVAFEVDHVDPASQQGWCVHARGRAERVEDPDLLAQLAQTPSPLYPGPWEERGRRLYMRIRWTELSGQAVGTRWNENLALADTPAVL